VDLGCPLPAMSVTDWDEQMAGWSTEAGAEVSAESAEPGPLGLSSSVLPRTSVPAAADVEADHWFLNDSSSEDDHEDDDSSEDEGQGDVTCGSWSRRLAVSIFCTSC
jgi:hypothetical protein